MATRTKNGSGEYYPVDPPPADPEPQTPQPVEGEINVVTAEFVLTGEHFPPASPGLFPHRFTHEDGRQFEHVASEPFHLYKQI